MRVAVAGGTGFVGGAIVAELARRGEHVVVLTHRPTIARAGLPDDVELRAADANGDPTLLDSALASVDALVVALAFPNAPMEDPARGWTYEHVDADGTTALVGAARRAGVSRLVYISGAGAAEDAERHWFRAKWRAEQAVAASGITATIIRPTWIYGPGDVSLNRFLGFARWLPVVPLTGPGTQLLAPVFIDDVARLAADSLREQAAAGRTFELGGPETYTMREIVAIALHVAGKRRAILPAPAALLRLGARAIQHLPGRMLTPDGVDFVNQPATVDVAPLLAAMPRRLTPLREGLESYLSSSGAR
ncbi:MAG TPA: NAD(P)H-binding protein [Candidatus Acidoferrales bacterium]|nr:NAD(P)H-binding protein [Candidatus Acidoferrales bacterium]